MDSAVASWRCDVGEKSATLRTRISMLHLRMPAAAPLEVGRPSNRGLTNPRSECPPVTSLGLLQSLARCRLTPRSCRLTRRRGIAATALRFGSYSSRRQFLASLPTPAPVAAPADFLPMRRRRGRHGGTADLGAKSGGAQEAVAVGGSGHAERSRIGEAVGVLPPTMLGAAPSGEEGEGRLSGGGGGDDGESRRGLTRETSDRANELRLRSGNQRQEVWGKRGWRQPSTGRLGRLRRRRRGLSSHLSNVACINPPSNYDFFCFFIG
ncbi:hypothetical protein BS78_02G018100 [Paspalum vaginatum]|nr:hypothetical protein BS78_02G018100 [Paspalum vaginatum]